MKVKTKNGEFELDPVWIERKKQYMIENNLNIDVVLEIRQANEWQIDNGLKTKKGYYRFLTTWLNRAERGPYNATNRKSTEKSTHDDGADLSAIFKRKS